MVQYDSHLEECFLRFIQQVLCAELLNILLILQPTCPPPPPPPPLLLPLLICFLPHFLCQDFHYANAVEIKSEVGQFFTILMPRLQNIQTTYFIFSLPR